MDLEVHRENVTVKTTYQVAVKWYEREVSAKLSSTIEVEYMVKDLDILLVDHYLDLIIYRESVRSHKYKTEYYKGARPSLSDMVESDPAYVVIHNKKEVRRYTGELKRVSPPYTYMGYSCFPGFEWAELGGPRRRRDERMMYGQRLESLEFGYIATNIMYMARPTAYYAIIDNETVTYTKSPSTGSSLIRIKIGDSVISLLVDKVSTHDYEKVMDSLKLDTSVLPSGVI